jgi:hypothetical protein
MLSHESWINSCLLDIIQTIDSNKFQNLGRVCGSCRRNEGDCVAHENT